MSNIISRGFSAPLPVESVFDVVESIQRAIDPIGLSTTLQVIKIHRGPSTCREITIQVSVDKGKYDKLDLPELTIRHSYILPCRGNTENPKLDKPTLDVCVNVIKGLDNRLLISAELFDLTGDVVKELRCFTN